MLTGQILSGSPCLANQGGAAVTIPDLPLLHWQHEESPSLEMQAVFSSVPCDGPGTQESIIVTLLWRGLPFNIRGNQDFCDKKQFTVFDFQ